MLMQEQSDLLHSPGCGRLQADIGVSSGNGKGQIFIRGEALKTVPESRAVETLLEEAPARGPAAGRGGVVTTAPPIPPLALPFPSRINPYTGALARDLEQWARDQEGVPARVMPAWRAARFERLVGRTFPTAPPALLSLTGEAVLWLFLYDDWFDPGGPGDDPAHAARITAELRQVLDGHLPAAPSDPLTGCVWWLRRQVLSFAGNRWWQRVAEDLYGFADAVRNEVAVRSQGRCPSPQGYLTARHFTSGWHLLTTLAELHVGTALPDGLRDSATNRALRAAAGDVACTVNDLLSLHKEAAAGEQHNLVLTLGNSEKCELPSAIGRAHDWLATRLHDYHQARDDLMSQYTSTDMADPASGAVALYVRGIEALMRGSLDWSLETGRYGHAAHTGHAAGRHQRVVVIGRGIASLTAAFRLQRAGFRVTVLERSAPELIGGRMSTIERGGFHVDVGATLLLSSYRAMIRLAVDAGLAPQIRPAGDVFGIVRGGDTQRVSTGNRLRMPRSPLLRGLPVRDLLKVAADFARMRPLFGWHDMSRTAPADFESVRDYAVRRGLHPATFEYLLAPFVAEPALCPPVSGEG